jgi:biotin carboxyl carrier protein
VVNKFKLVLDGVSYEIEHRDDMILVNGVEFPWTISGSSVVVAGNTHTVDVKDDAATVDGIVYPIEAIGLEEPKAEEGRRAALAGHEETGAITAVMPGLIIKINKQEGDRVEAGEVVLILEAMKMQNEVHAKQSGVVKQIKVQVGQSVEVRQVLAIVE